MYPIASDFKGIHDLDLIFEPFFPPAADGFFVDVKFGQLDEEVIVAGLTFHESAVELAKVVIFEAFAEAFEAFATAGFDESEEEEAVEEPLIFVGPFLFKFLQLIDIDILPLAAQLEPAFFQLGEDEAEMAPFFGDDRREFVDETLFVAVALDEGDATGSCFLFAPGVIGQDGFEGYAAQMDPARVGGKLESEDVLLTGRGFHGAKLRTFAGNFAMRDESFLDRKLAERRVNAAFRALRLPEGKVDLCSNDYLGVVRDGLLEEAAPEALPHGSGGSRLLAGNYELIGKVEQQLAEFHAAPAALIYNSGYDANLGLLSCVPQRGDVVLYDALSHASIRDGMRLSFAQAYSFAHNDCTDLERRLSGRSGSGSCFVVTESVFSMDGDLAPLTEMAALCRQYGAQLIVDEAHATGVIGRRGEGLVQVLGLQQDCFARVHTFGKAVGGHGAAVLGSFLLRDYLINFSRSLIYTTALPPASIGAIARAYALLPTLEARRAQLQQLIDQWRATEIGYQRLDSRTPIQVVIVPGNDAVRAVAAGLQEAGLDVRQILYPTVPKGSERLRIVLHAFNTTEEIGKLAGLLKK